MVGKGSIKSSYEVGRSRGLGRGEGEGEGREGREESLRMPPTVG